MNQQESNGGRFGTFGGGFTPVTLTILGVIMFLRFGQVVGQAGIFQALLIVLAAKAITLLTTLSLSATATNTRVEGGGAYFLISRSLGVEVGGAIGIVLFLAQATSVAMYVLGFTEALVDILPAGFLSARAIATIINLIVFASVFIGAGWTIKLQYGILAALGVSLLSFHIGAGMRFDMSNVTANWSPGYTEGVNFPIMFALFFPAVTGIMAGANMSGDLKSPARAIPLGTLSAIGVTALIYLSQALILGGATPRDALITNNLVIKEIALVAWLVTMGILAATLSSALGSMMGAPRILQALAKDDVFPILKPFARQFGKNREPRVATVGAFAIAQGCILMGGLDAIAPIITMFFMITYGMINLVTFYESITKNPSYRPRFKYSHWSTALLGAVGCGIAMLLINPLWAIGASVVMYAVYWYVSRHEIVVRWGDMRGGIAYERARQNLLSLERCPVHPKNWRPTLIALTGGAHNRAHLAVYGHWLTAGHGILTLANIMVGDVNELADSRETQEKLLRDYIEEHDLQAFPSVTVAPNLTDGIRALVQCYGLGSLRPNTILLGWSRDEDRAETFGRTLRTLARLKRDIAAVRTSASGVTRWIPPDGTIDVWWRSGKNGELMVLMAHLLHQNREWRTRSIRVIRMIEDESGREEATAHLGGLIDSARITATPVVVVSNDVDTAMRTASANAAAVFVGFEPPEEGREVAFLRRMDAMTHSLHTVIFVDSSSGAVLEA
ncbi:MAG: amino acid permease [Candidatus Poribacteria bacterium]|nr:amino acid permease [Candidatus Poribacteria bacterium]